MDTQRRRAIAAGMSEQSAHALRTGALQAGFELVGCAPDAYSALRMIADLQPDLALAEAVMPGMDGVAFARRVRTLRLNVYPSVLLLRLSGLRLPDVDGLEALGAVLIDKPATAEAISAGAERLALQALPPDRAAQLEALLDALGVPEHPGRECLRCAVGLAWADRRRLHALRDRLYPGAAKLAGCTPAQAERAIRHVIDAAWRTGEIEQQHKIFGDTIDARRGRPTCGEMIAQLADILRWEGRK